MFFWLILLLIHFIKFSVDLFVPQIRDIVNKNISNDRHKHRYYHKKEEIIIIVLYTFFRKVCRLFIVLPISSCYFRFLNNATQRYCYFDIMISYYYGINFLLWNKYNDLTVFYDISNEYVMRETCVWNFPYYIV